MEQELDWFLNNLGRDVIQLSKVPLAEGQEKPLPNAKYEELFDANGAPLRESLLDDKLDPIIWEIRRKMEDTRKQCRKVYLGQPKNDFLRSACRDLKTALHGSALSVLPNEVVTQRTLESKIQKWIEDAVVSIHIQTNPPDPLAETQHRIAQQAGTPALILPGAPRKDDLPDIVKKVREMVASARRQGEVYFIYDHHSDLELAHRIRPDIEVRTNRKVILPQPGETYHRAKLSESDGIILFRAAAPQSWYESQRQTLQQASALRGGRFVPEAFYAVASGTPERVNCLQSANGRWEIDRVGLPDITDLQPFFDALAASAAAAGGQA